MDLLKYISYLPEDISQINYLLEINPPCMHHARHGGFFKFLTFKGREHISKGKLSVYTGFMCLSCLSHLNMELPRRPGALFEKASGRVLSKKKGLRESYIRFDLNKQVKVESDS